MLITLDQHEDLTGKDSSPYAHIGVSRVYADRFFIEFHHDADGGFFGSDQARQLRDELTAFLGDEHDEAIRNATTMWKRMGIADDYTYFLLRLTNDMNVRRGDEIDRLQAEAETLRKRVASLEKDNRDLRLSTAAHEVESAHLHAIMEGFIDDAKSLLLYFRGTTE